ncbi:conserved oligomeric Golgi complex subunit 6-like [Pyrus x bretschneideri]|uniref:conserved oligomeric Golgi complex subunit 6-like n=1 Tax=Pyrus x bretschneideri TaxID=225117 RepID=UPI00202F6B64|nr:conserved oligomeric Golgi complex subunit 6-like [Pyrus x bretschneideri]
MYQTLCNFNLANLTRAKLAPGLSRKLKKVLECRTDSPDVLASLNTLSSFYSENTPQSRRNLRSTIEKRGLATNLKFLKASLAAQEALATSCDKIAVALSSCTATTEGLMQIVSCFLREYQLSNQEKDSLIISYKLSNTLEFYSHTVSEFIGRETALSDTLWTLKDAAQKTFFDILKTRGEKLLRYPPLVSVELSPPPAVREEVSLLLEIVETHNSMMLPTLGKNPSFGPVISALLDPIIKSSETSSKIFLINCLCAIQQPLLGHEVAEEYVKCLGMIAKHMQALVENEVDVILKRCGLYPSG